jgi:hypothetical protein
VVVEEVVVFLPAVLGTFLGVLASFPAVLDRSMPPFLSLCWPFAVVVTFEQLSCHQQAGIRRRIHCWFWISYSPSSTNSCG